MVSIGGIKKFILVNFLLLLSSAATVSFILPSKATTGGFIGVAYLLFKGLGLSSQYREGVTVGLIALSLNIPLLLYSYSAFGKGYFWKTLFGTLMMPIYISSFDYTLSYFNIKAPLINPYLSVTVGSAVVGLTIALLMVMNGSTGGTDIIAKILNHSFHKITLGFGTIIANLLVILFSTFILGEREAFLSIIAIALKGITIDLIIGSIELKR